MSTAILLLAVALTLHVMPPIMPAAVPLAVQYLWLPVVLSGIAVLLAIGADSLRNAERGR